MRRFGMSVICYIKLTDTDSCNMSKSGKCYRKFIFADSCNILRIVALSDQKRFGNDYFMSSVNLFKTVVKISLCQNYHIVAQKSLLHKSHCDKKITVAQKSLLHKSHCCKKSRQPPSSGNMEPPPVEIWNMFAAANYRRRRPTSPPVEIRLDPTSGNMVD